MAGSPPRFRSSRSDFKLTWDGFAMTDFVERRSTLMSARLTPERGRQTTFVMQHEAPRLLQILPVDAG